MLAGNPNAALPIGCGADLLDGEPPPNLDNLFGKGVARFHATGES